MKQRRRRRSVFRFVPVFLLVFAVLPASDEEPEFPHGDFDGDCTQCHSDEGWTPTAISREFRRSVHPFPLRQAHDLENCRACHSNLDFTLADPACVACHMDPHRGEMGIDCARCHVPRNFIDRTRMQRAHQETRFPLRGSHRALDCEDCHPIVQSGRLQFVNTPVECEACHLPLYQTTSDPDHAASGFPTDCDQCHAPSVWEQGRFNHAFAQDPCVTCHQDDYDATSDPDHTAASFPTDCELCHTPTRWGNATFDHVAFPIYSGRHRGRWDACSTCHITPADFSDFSCFGCHPHSDEQETTSDHDDVDGFQYHSVACYACHPQGEADD